MAAGGKHPGCKAEATNKNEWNIPLLPYMPSWKTQGQHPFTFHSKSITYNVNNS
jgi:hypothetical protein